MNRAYTEYTLKGFQDMEYFGDSSVKFNEIIIVPMNDVHDSGFRCMKFILLYYGDIVAVVGGFSDVIHINGIGGYGKDYLKGLKSDKMDRIAYKIDCLPESNCIRLFADAIFTTTEFIGSDFQFYAMTRREAHDEGM